MNSKKPHPLQMEPHHPTRILVDDFPAAALDINRLQTDGLTPTRLAGLWARLAV